MADKIRKASEGYADDQKKEKKPIFFKVFLCLMVFFLILLLIPSRVFEDLMRRGSGATPDSLEEGQVAVEEEQRVLSVESMDDYGYKKFNTVFGGLDYETEVREFLNKHTFIGYESLCSGIEERITDGVFDSLLYDVESYNAKARAEEQRIYEETGGMGGGMENLPGFVDSFKGFEEGFEEYDTFYVSSKDCYCAGVLKNYYPIFWFEGSHTILVMDESLHFFNPYYFTRDMYHVGSNRYDIFVMSEAYRLEKIGAYDVYFLGTNLNGEVEEDE